MKPSEFYQKLLSELSSDLERKVFEVMSRQMGKRVTREHLITAIFGITMCQDISSSAEDRKIRKCIEALRMKGFPIIASSGEAGYTLVDDVEQIDQYIAEESGRVEHLRSKIKMLYAARHTAKHLRIWRESTDVPVQERMF